MPVSHRLVWPACAAAALLTACAYMPWNSSEHRTSFFITSTNPGQGGDFGGLAGADAHCQKLAAAAGASGKTWRAYLSATAEGGQPVVNARERIGAGPWVNARGVTVASSLADLHSADVNINKATALTERGDVVPGFGDPVNRHDILTGSRPDGTLAVPEPGKDSTCGNWTRSEGGSAIAGHHDRKGSNPDPVANASWNSSHGTRGCSPMQLAQSGSAGLVYCFAQN